MTDIKAVQRADGGDPVSDTLELACHPLAGFRTSVSHGLVVGTEGIDVHPQHTVGRTRVQAFRAGVFAGGPQRHIQGQQMLFTRVVLGRKRRLPPVVEQIVGPLRGQRGMEPVGESVDPIRGGIVRPLTAPTCSD